MNAPRWLDVDADGRPVWDQRGPVLTTDPVTGALALERTEPTYERDRNGEARWVLETWHEPVKLCPARPGAGLVHPAHQPCRCFTGGPAPFHPAPKPHDVTR